MTASTIWHIRKLPVLVGLIALMIAGAPSFAERTVDDQAEDHATTATYIVRANSSDTAAAEVLRVGGSVISRLPVIDGVGATLNAEQLERLRSRAGIRAYENRELHTSGKKTRDKRTRNETTVDASTMDLVADTSVAPDTSDEELVADSQVEETPTSTDGTTEFTRSSEANGYLEWSELSRTLESVPYEHPVKVNAPDVHHAHTRGKGIGVAVIDTGLWWEADTVLEKSPVARFDTTGQDVADDPHGHGTHVANIIASNRFASNKVFEGIAPEADIVAVRAFGFDGSGNYLDVIEAIDLVVAHRSKFNIRVLNLSFSAPPQSHYWDDPLNQAVMAAWEAGIVVVVSAGNSGPEPMTVGVPGNVPYVITVGAMSDNFSTTNPEDDPLTSFSSVGPTYEGFVKPDVVAPGGHIVSALPYDSYISANHPDSLLSSERHFAMSGTSQAAAITSGIAALMLAANPELSPDDVKCRLMSSAQPAVDDSGNLGYSVFQQGAGLVNALAAVQSTATGCANVGLNIRKDLKGQQHFGGPANQDESGNFYIMDGNGDPLDADGYVWSRAYLWGRGYVWSQGYVWSRGYVWSQGYVWSKAYFWSQSLPWQESDVFSSGLVEPMSVNKWVGHE